MKIETITQLRELYGWPSGRAKNKVLNALEQHAINFIQQAPFAIISTMNKKGQLDASPRGGQAGFVEITNKNQLLIPDAKGNNRVDSLENIVETGRIGMIFLVPGIDETLRVNGSAYISIAPELLARFTDDRVKSCIVVEIEEAFLHCAKALMRSKLWSAATQIDRKEFPTMGQMLKDQLQLHETPESHEEMVERYQKDI